MTRVLPWALWLAIVSSFGVAIGVGGAIADDGEGSVLAFTVFVLAFTTTGALIASRRPANPIGWILLGAGLAYAVGGLTVSAVENRSDPPALVGWVSTWVWMAGIGPAATFGLLLFPDGRLPSPRWRWAGWLAAAANLLTIGGIALAPGRFDDSTVENPVGLDAAPAVPDAMAAAGAVLLAAAIAASIASVIVRFRHARDVERQQLKWLAFAGVLVGVALALAISIETVVGEAAVDVTNTIISLALAAVPVAMGIAILRHRLYDIDVVVNRTLVYGALTATLAAAYFALALLLGLTVGRTDVTVALSTLAVAALFGPARARIQAAVDRRFYRRRYDAERTLAAFNGRLRDEIDLEALGADLRAVTQETVQPAHVSLWLRGER
jgi:hypothetical protein